VRDIYCQFWLQLILAYLHDQPRSGIDFWYPGFLIIPDLNSIKVKKNIFFFSHQKVKKRLELLLFRFAIYRITNYAI
jgi:hypothetical protein